MRIAVVTPYYNEKPEWLRRCYDSVKAQTRPADLHLFVADGTPNAEIDGWACDHLTITGPNKDAGSAARGIGALQCVAHGFDAIAFLDSDNWFKPDHIESLARLVQEKKVAVGVSFCDPYRTDGTMIQKGEAPDPRVAIDPSCLFITREAFPLLPLWLRFPTIGQMSKDPSQREWTYGGYISDRIFAYALHTFNVPLALLDHSTVCYTVKSETYLKAMGEALPPEANKDSQLLDAWNWWKNLSPLERVNIVIKALPRDRRPKVEAG